MTQLQKNFLRLDGHQQGLVFMLLSIVLFAASTLVVMAAASLPGVNGWTATAMRGLVGLVIVGVLFWPRRQFQPAHLLQNPLLILRGVLGAIGTATFYLCMMELGAGRVTVIGSTYTVFASLLAVVFLKEKVSLAQLLWMTVALLGLTLVTGFWEGGGGNPVWDAIAVAGAVVAGGVVVCIRALRHQEHMSTIYSAQCFYGLLLVTPPVAIDAPAFSLMAVVLMVLASILVAVGQLTMTRAYLDLPVAKGASLQLLLPVVTAVGAALFLGERYSLLDILGTVIILVGCFQMVRIKREPATLNPAQKLRSETAAPEGSLSLAEQQPSTRVQQ